MTQQNDLAPAWSAHDDVGIHGMMPLTMLDGRLHGSHPRAWGQAFLVYLGPSALCAVDAQIVMGLTVE